MGQEASRWASSNKDMDYFLRQLDAPYQSTISFCDFLDEKMLINEDSLLMHVVAPEEIHSTSPRDIIPEASLDLTIRRNFCR